ncbi:hypothetical protein AVEN_55449-1 [Araneus ventricosus]|uniref:Uncharacterized protein n=1 Tax=Araneus ventricosus TaxID=182803 RepID=A0A4Y2MPN5_ARAVE|nr:hypothetical protein AVEN_55449-1 [Araneus ventricosus]
MCLKTNFGTSVKDLPKAGHLPLVHFGIFGTREGKTNRQGRKPMKLEQMIGSGGIPTNSKSKTSSTDSNLGPRCESSGKEKDLPTLGPRVEARNEIRNPHVLGKKSVGGKNSATLNLVSEHTLDHP